MEQESFERTKRKTKKIASDSNTSKFERVLIAGDFNGCLLVIPDILGTREQITHYQGRLHKYQL